MSGHRHPRLGIGFRVSTTEFPSSAEEVSLSAVATRSSAIMNHRRIAVDHVFIALVGSFKTRNRTRNGFFHLAAARQGTEAPEES